MVCKIFFAPNSPIFWKSRGEEKENTENGEEGRENRQMQSVLFFKQTQKYSHKL